MRNTSPMRYFYLFFGAALVLCAAGCHPSTAPEAAGIAPAVSSPPVSSSGAASLNADPTTYALFADGYARVPVALLSPDDLDTAILARGAITNAPGPQESANPQVLEDLVLSGRMAVVAHLTRVTKTGEAGTQPHIGDVVRVQIVDGPYRGKTGWVGAAWLQR